MGPDQRSSRRSVRAAVHLVVASGVLLVVRLVFCMVDVEDGHITIWIGRALWMLALLLTDWSWLPIGLAVGFALLMRSGGAGAHGATAICSAVAVAPLMVALIPILTWGQAGWPLAAMAAIMICQLVLLTTATVLLVRAFANPATAQRSPPPTPPPW